VFVKKYCIYFWACNMIAQTTPQPATYALSPKQKPLVAFRTTQPVTRTAYYLGSIT